MGVYNGTRDVAHFVHRFTARVLEPAKGGTLNESRGEMPMRK